MDTAKVEGRPKVLLVDDEPAVLEGLELRLRKEYDLFAAFGGAQALDVLVNSGPFAIVLSDMRMPGMDGAALLSRVRELAPYTVRMLLTGHADTESAISAVNDGQVFRFLSKPCRPEVLQRAMQDALTHHRLLISERELLENTLRGAVKALSEVLSLTDPEAFGRAARVQRLALALAARLKLQPSWPLELAILLAPLGRVSLPADVVRRENLNEALNPDERAMLSRVPQVTERLIGSIPRLESVRAIMRLALKPTGGSMPPAGSTPELHLEMRSARILRLATDYDELESRGNTSVMVIAELHNRSGAYDDELLAALDAVKGTGAADIQIYEVPARLLKAGMVLVEDLCTVTGQPLVTRGYEVTASFVERVQNFRPGVIREPVRVIMPRTGA